MWFFVYASFAFDYFVDHFYDLKFIFVGCNTTTTTDFWANFRHTVDINWIDRSKEPMVFIESFVAFSWRYKWLLEVTAMNELIPVDKRFNYSRVCVTDTYDSSLNLPLSVVVAVQANSTCCTAILKMVLVFRRFWSKVLWWRLWNKYIVRRSGLSFYGFWHFKTQIFIFYFIHQQQQSLWSQSRQQQQQQKMFFFCP